MKITATPSQTIELLNTVFLPNREPVLLVGRPGIGKSDIFTQVAEQSGQKLIIRHCVTDDPTDYKGLGAITGDHKADFIPFGDLEQLIEAKEKTICFLDDVGQAPHSVQAALMQPVLARRINGHKISDNVTFVAATNRVEDKAGVNRLLSALLSRFSIIQLEPSLGDWVNWALKNDMPLELISFCRSKPSTILEWSPSKDIENTPNPRNIEVVGRMMNQGLSEELQTIVFTSRLGHGAGVELAGFLKLAKQLPTIDEIILNPTTARLPTEPSATYLLTSAMVRHATPMTLESIFKYMGRISPEYTVMMAQDISVKRPELLETKAWVSWAANNEILNQ